MPRPSFFKEFKRRDICPPCKEGRNTHCELEFCLDPYEKSTHRFCWCDCQLTPNEIRNREQAKRINDQTKGRHTSNVDSQRGHQHRHFVDFNTGDAVCLCRKIRGEKKAAPGKYHVSRPSAEYNGVFHDSKFEAETAMSLDWQLKAKEIKGWVRQFPIEIRSPRSDLNPAAQGGLPHRELREHTFSRTAERGV